MMAKEGIAGSINHVWIAFIEAGLFIASRSFLQLSQDNNVLQALLDAGSRN